MYVNTQQFRQEFFKKNSKIVVHSLSNIKMTLHSDLKYRSFVVSGFRLLQETSEPE